MTAVADLPGDAPIVIPHADDVGMCHGANRAFMELAGLGFVTTGSVMVPCPWFPENSSAELAIKLLTRVSNGSFGSWPVLTSAPSE